MEEFFCHHLPKMWRSLQQIPENITIWLKSLFIFCCVDGKQLVLKLLTVLSQVCFSMWTAIWIIFRGVMRFHVSCSLKWVVLIGLSPEAPKVFSPSIFFWSPFFHYKLCDNAKGNVPRTLLSYLMPEILQWKNLHPADSFIVEFLALNCVQSPVSAGDLRRWARCMFVLRSRGQCLTIGSIHQPEIRGEKNGEPSNSFT